VILKLGAKRPTGRLGMNLFFAGTDISAQKAQTDGDFQRVVTSMSQYLATTGITLDTGNVSYIDLSESDAQTYNNLATTEGPASELRSMLALSAGQPEGRVNTFFVRTITGQLAGYILLGKSAGIPGPPGLNGTASSGVVVGLDSYGEGAWRTHFPEVAATWAHELSHFMGLYHTTEKDGSAFDTLPDTPECGKSKDTNGDGVLSPQECAGLDGSNIMFWAASADGRNYPPQQAEALRANPLAR